MLRRILQASRADWARITLGTQVILSGFVVMALEILGSRLIAPVYGNTTYTWASLIGVVLSGLAVGYHYGGKMADRYNSRELFSFIVFTGGLLVVMVPFISPFALAISVSLKLGGIYGPLLSSTLVLGLPSSVLGMVSPYAVKIAAEDMSRLGKTTGNLYSLSTFGSILGAFGAAFVLIPLLDLRTILYGLGTVLMLAALIWLPRFAAVFTVIIVLLLVTTFTTSFYGALIHAGPITYEKQTPYGQLDVVDSGNQRVLFINGLPQSAMDKDNPSKLVFTYTQYFHLGVVANTQVQRVLFVGGGGFSGPKSFLATYPSIMVDVVEIDPDVIQVAKTYFSVPSDPRLTIYNEDARVYLEQTGNTYDMIVLDAYAKTYVPFHLMTQEFMTLLSSRLNQQGIIVSNLIGSLVGDTSDIIRAEYETITSVFHDTAVFTTSNLGIGYVQNIMIFFKNQAQPPLSSLVSNTTAAEKMGIPLPPDYLGHLYGGEIQTSDVPLLTDNHAPVETLLNPVTGRPYVIEQQTGKLPTPTLDSNTVFTLTLVLLIGVAWATYLFRRRTSLETV